MFRWLRSMLFGTPSITRGRDGNLRAHVAGHRYEGRNRDALIVAVSRARDQVARTLSEVQRTEAGSVPYISGPLDSGRQPSDALRRVERKLGRNLTHYDEFLGNLSNQ